LISFLFVSELGDVVSGESPTVYDSSFFQIQWGKNYITLISQTFYGNSFQVKVSELALEALSPFQYNMSFESNTTNISPISLMLNEVEVEYVFTEFTRFDLPSSHCLP